MRKSEESDAQEHAQWAQHVAKVVILPDLFQAFVRFLMRCRPTEKCLPSSPFFQHGQLYRLGQAKPMGEQPRSWGSEAMVGRPIGPVVEGADDLGCQIQRPLKILIVRHGEVGSPYLDDSEIRNPKPLND
jgi:hypothetical protein